MPPENNYCNEVILNDPTLTVNNPVEGHEIQIIIGSPSKVAKGTLIDFAKKLTEHTRVNQGWSGVHAIVESRELRDLSPRVAGLWSYCSRRVLPKCRSSGIGIRYRANRTQFRSERKKTGVGAAAMGSIFDVGSFCGEALLSVINAIFLSRSHFAIGMLVSLPLCDRLSLDNALGAGARERQKQQHPELRLQAAQYLD